MKKILLFTDSRGQYIPVGFKHKIFGERIKVEFENVDVDLVLCPMKWTTTIDFFEYAESNDLSIYDHIILYTGIVEWSPRPQLSANNDLYNNKTKSKIYNWTANTRDYSKKIVNDKKKIFDQLFGEKYMMKYLNKPFNTKYEGEHTINLYGLDMLEKVIIPKLLRIDNLIVINSNKIVNGWEGDFKRGRPENISIIHQYAELISKSFPKGRIIDLYKWTDAEIQKYTCDNMHLTEQGSQYIMDAIEKKLNLKKNNIKVSVIVPVYNVEKYIVQCLDSIMKQSLKEIEIIIVNDGSTDNSLNLINRYKKDPRVKIITQQNKGLSGARNTGLKIAKGEFISFIDSDDYIDQFMLESMVTKASLDGADIVMCQFKKVDDNGNSKFISDLSKFSNISKEEAFKIYLSAGHSAVVWANIYKRKLFTENKILFPEGIYHEDIPTTYKLFYYAKKITTVGKIYYFWRDRDGSISKSITEKHIDDTFRIYELTKIFLIQNNIFSEMYKYYIKRTFLYTIGLVNKLNYAASKIDNARGQVLKVMRKMREDGYETDETLQILSNYDHQLYIKYMNIVKNQKIYKETLPALSDISQMERDRLSNLKNKFYGKRCFILGNGPSLNKCDLALLKDEYTFGVNGIFYKTKEMGFRPTFYMVEDNHVIDDNLNNINEYDIQYKFFPSIYKDRILETKNTYFFRVDMGFYSGSHPFYCKPRFTEDFSDVSYAGQSVTYMNIQLAYYLGFTEVYLIGMDFSYQIRKTDEAQGQTLISNEDDINHFHPDYFGKGKKWHDPKVERVGWNYKFAKKHFEKNGRKIYNATIDGNLEIFERKNYYSLFEKKQENNSFANANKLFRRKSYSEALNIYLKLTELEPNFNRYKESAIICYMKAKELNQPIDSEIIEKIRKFI